jgi:hypothetical protein
VKSRDNITEETIDVPKRVRLDLLVFAAVAELLWSYCLWMWTRLVVNSWLFEPWELFSSWIADFGVICVFGMFAILDCLIIYVLECGFKGKPLIQFLN